MLFTRVIWASEFDHLCSHLITMMALISGEPVLTILSKRITLFMNCLCIVNIPYATCDWTLRRIEDDRILLFLKFYCALVRWVQYLSQYHPDVQLKNVQIAQIWYMKCNKSMFSSRSYPFGVKLCQKSTVFF